VCLPLSAKAERPDFCLAAAYQNNFVTFNQTMFIVKHKKIFIGISIALVVLSLVSLFSFGLNVGIDFKGGALSEVVYKDARPSQDELDKPLLALGFGTILLQPTGDLGYIVKSRDLNDAEHALLLGTLGGTNTLTEMSFNSIGPTVGRELTRKAILAIILISLAIICFIAFAFRKVSKPVSSWKYGLIAIITLLHDVVIPVGLFVLLNHFYGAEADTLFVVAVLTILGLSLSDTIVIFDRIRENLRNEGNSSKINFSEIVGKSLNESYVRSICTSLTVILVLLALFFFGPITTRYFALMLTAGMFFGTYSSIFLASPLLVLAEELQKKK
jgi:preprotein translocase subunit SecF